MENNIETERRFLLKSLPNNLRWSNILRINQKYLSEINSDIVERVRHVISIDSGINSYFHTITTKFSNEIEKEITEEEYIKMSYLSSKKFRSILKERYIKYDNNLKWEIDDMHNNKLIIAEIELPSEDFELVIPDWLQPFILLEITGMKQFSNSNLAN